MSGVNFRRTAKDAVKRGFDFTVAAVGLLVLSPLLAVIAVVIKLTSEGPVIYRGTRSGLGGKEFAIYKFRSMVDDAEKLGGMSTGKNDPRVTPVGSVLRRYKLDELPQLLNVFKGEMSLVGPRPEMPAYTKLYSEKERVILTVRPGITDFASLEFIRLDEALGSENPDLVYETRVRPLKNALRVKYVETRSLWVHLKLIMRTLARLIGVGKASRVMTLEPTETKGEPVHAASPSLSKR